MTVSPAGPLDPSTVPDTDPVRRRATQDAGLAWTVQHAARSPALRTQLERAGVAPGDVRGVDDLAALPFTSKADLRDAGPLGWTCVPNEQVVRVHASSGTTGARTIVSYTADDIEDWTVQFARCYRLAGVAASDRVQVTPGFGLWTAGAGFSAGAERLGAMVIPTGPGDVELQLEMLQALGSTVLCATASFALLLAEQTRERGLDAPTLTTGIFGSERWGPAVRGRIEQLLEIETFDIYGMTELYGPGVGIEGSEHDGINVFDDAYLVEIVEPGGARVLPAGELGEVVVTTLRKQATPLIRYRTGDLSRLLPVPAGAWPRLAPLTGRVDDAVKVRGVLVMPAQVEAALGLLAGAGSEYQVHVARSAGRDELLVRLEATDPDCPVRLAEQAAHVLRRELGVRADVEVVAAGALPRSAGKTRRVFDSRP